MDIIARKTAEEELAKEALLHADNGTRRLANDGVSGGGQRAGQAFSGSPADDQQVRTQALCHGANRIDGLSCLKIDSSRSGAGCMLQTFQIFP